MRSAGFSLQDVGSPPTLARAERLGDPVRQDPRSDAELIAAANRGDAAAFEALYRRHRDWVVRLARRFVGDHERALNVTQETFLFLLGRFPGFVLRAKLRTFLYPVVRHRAQEELRRARRFPASTEEAQVPEPSAPADDGTLETREALEAALARLPEAQREAVILRFVDGLSLDEVAQATEVPAGTVKSRLHHALRALRAQPSLRRHFPGEKD